MIVPPRPPAEIRRDQGGGANSLAGELGEEGVEPGSFVRTGGENRPSAEPKIAGGTPPRGSDLKRSLGGTQLPKIPTWRVRERGQLSMRGGIPWCHPFSQRKATANLRRWAVLSPRPRWRGRHRPDPRRWRDTARPR